MEHHRNIKKGFTLAEVLITLGIIGVVAALTIPTLIAKYNERVLVTAAKKEYSIILNALDSWLAKNGTPKDYKVFWLMSDSNEKLSDELSKELKYVKLCSKNYSVAKCGGGYDIRQYKKINDGTGQTTSENWISGLNRIVLSDGSFITIQLAHSNGSCTTKGWAYDKDADGNYIEDPSSPNGYKGHEVTNTVCGRIAYDTNGLKGPNQIGRDVFQIAFYDDGKVGTNYDTWGNINYVLSHDKLIETENYVTGEY